jgi:hypothetical protein
LEVFYIVRIFEIAIKIHACRPDYAKATSVRPRGGGDQLTELSLDTRLRGYDGGVGMTLSP